MIVQVAIKVFEFTLKYSNQGRLSNVKVKFQKETFNENDKELVLCYMSASEKCFAFTLVYKGLTIEKPNNIDKGLLSHIQRLHLIVPTTFFQWNCILSLLLSLLTLKALNLLSFSLSLC